MASAAKKLKERCNDHATMAQIATSGLPLWRYGLGQFDALHRAVLAPMRKQSFRSLHW